MGGLFETQTLPPIPTLPPMPSISTPAVQQASEDEGKKRAMAQGRASTYLTDLQTQRTASPSRQRVLGSPP